MDMPKQDSDFGTVTCHGSCYILKGDDALMDADELPLIGQHNIVNVLAALALGTMFSYWFINALIAVIVAMALVALESL
jgi:UDP-N-acetylmuramoylalanine--D-glutamate ligase